MYMRRKISKPLSTYKHLNDGKKNHYFVFTVAITWKNAPENQYPIVGSTYNVKCEVTANPAPTVDWLRNGDPVS